MEEKYGKKLSTLKVSGMIYLPTVMLSILFGAVFFILLSLKIKNGAEAVVGVPVIVIIGIIFVACVYSIIRQAVNVKMDVYDKHLVEYTMFKTNVIAADEVKAILWQFPGANPMNSRAARVNNTSAEFIFNDSTKKSKKIQDSYYQNMEKEISSWQSRNAIPKDLEVKKKAGHRYD